MNKTLLGVLGIILIILGESLAIYLEITAAKENSLRPGAFLKIFSKLFLIMIVASGFIMAGYMLGFATFKNIWIVSVVSITSILIVEPAVNFLIMKQFPTKGAIIGFILGVIGFVTAIFWD